jgi:hypothetical protein
MADNPEIASKIKELKDLHRKLDLESETLAMNPVRGQIKFQRLKKEKLALKDQIAVLSASDVPDIIA